MKVLYGRGKGKHNPPDTRLVACLPMVCAFTPSASAEPALQFAVLSALRLATQQLRGPSLLSPAAEARARETECAGDSPARSKGVEGAEGRCRVGGLAWCRSGRGEDAVPVEVGRVEGDAKFKGPFFVLFEIMNTLMKT